MVFNSAATLCAISFAMTSVGPLLVDFRKDHPDAALAFHYSNLVALFASLLFLVVHAVAVIRGSFELVQVSKKVFVLAVDAKLLSFIPLVYMVAPAPTHAQFTTCLLLAMMLPMVVLQFVIFGNNGKFEEGLVGIRRRDNVD